MTIREALETFDRLRPNIFTRHDKIRWLSELDGKVRREIIDTHVYDEDTPETFTGYDDTTALTTELLAPYPYDDIYFKWLAAQADLHTREMGNFNNSIALFNAGYEDFRNWYNSTHMALGEKLCFFGRRMIDNGPLSE
jgi:hypothetical protein